MSQIVILADDFTGALDTGIQLAQKGMRTAVCSLPSQPDWMGEAEVLVIDTQTRHLSGKQAGRIVFSLAQDARRSEAKLLYKKTDSTLRGNIGAELEGALNGFGEETLGFIPAYPKLGRTTQGMIHRVDNVLLAETSYAKDALNPIRSSRIDAILAEQTSLPVSAPGDPSSSGRGILLYDWVRQEEGGAILEDVCRRGLRVLAGCAGFAEYLDRLVPYARQSFSRTAPARKLLLVSGSIHPQSLLQLEAAKSAGWPLVELPRALSDSQEDPSGTALFEDTLSTLRAGLAKKGRAILAAATRCPSPESESPSGWEARARNISLRLGELTRKALQEEPGAALIVFGGDTAAQVIRACGGQTLYPLFRALEGIPYCEFSPAFRGAGDRMGLITKAGGFGPPDIVPRLEELLQREGPLS